MSSSTISQQSKELVRAAGRTIFEPYFSIEEKLLAIDFLESIPTDESIDILKQAIDLISCPLESRGEDDGLPELPITGLLRGLKPRHGAEAALNSDQAGFNWLPIAERAARALARNDHPEGIIYLVIALTSPEVHVRFREIAAHGLGSSTTTQALEALSDALRDKDLRVRDRALRSLKECIDRLGPSGLARPDVAKAVVAIAALAITAHFEDDLIGDKSVELARFVVNHYRVPAVEQMLLDFIRTSDKESKITTAIEILCKTFSLEAARTLAELMLDENRPATFYLEVGMRLSGTRDPYIRDVAESILNEKPNLLGNVRNMISSRRSHISSVRREAAKQILVGN